MAVVRRRGRPVNSDSAETRNRILKASRQVITERGYQAATFQAIAMAAGLSRPTLHYYFSSREEIYLTLVAEARNIVADFISRVRRDAHLVEQFSTLVRAMHDTDRFDRSQIAFLVSARLESTRNPELRVYAGTALKDFLAELVDDAKARGELPGDCATEPVAELLYSMLWGVSFYAGFVDTCADLTVITQQLEHMVAHGLLPTKSPVPTGYDPSGDSSSGVASQRWRPAGD